MELHPVTIAASDARVARMLDVLDRDRALWARELEEQTLQSLAALTIRLAPIARATDDDHVLSVLDQVHTEIRHIRWMVAELHPAELDLLGLQPALEALAARASHIGAVGVRTFLHLRAEPPAGPEALLVFRLVQEALTNAVRHAKAQSVAVSATSTARELQLVVRDDGHGFDPVSVVSGLGLHIVRERVALAGGTLRIDSGSGGTTVRVDLPRS